MIIKKKNNKTSKRIKRINMKIIHINILAILATIFIIAMIGMSYANELSGLRVYILPERNFPGDEKDIVQVVIIANNMKDITDLKFKLGYDSNVLIAKNITSDIVSDADLYRQISNNYIIIGLTKQSGITPETGDSRIVKIIFKSIGSKGGSSPLDVTIIEAKSSLGQKVNISRIYNARYDVGRSLVVLPGETRETTLPIETTQPVETTATKTPGFGIIVSIIVIIVCTRIRVLKDRIKR